MKSAHVSAIESDPDAFAAWTMHCGRMSSILYKDLNRNEKDSMFEGSIALKLNWIRLLPFISSSLRPPYCALIGSLKCLCLGNGRNGSAHAANMVS